MGGVQLTDFDRLETLGVMHFRVTGDIQLHVLAVAMLLYNLYFIACWKTRFNAYAESLGVRLQPFSMSTAVIPNRFLYPYSHSKLLIVSEIWLKMTWPVTLTPSMTTP